MAVLPVRGNDVTAPTAMIERQVTAAVDGISHLIDGMDPMQRERLRVPAEMAVEALDEVLLRLRGPAFPRQ